MTIDDLIQKLDPNKIGNEIYSLIERLFPICRSITGDGVRETLRILNDHILIQIHEVPSGKKVFDWTIPKEWNIRDAYVKNKKGEKVIDFKKSNLHVLNYSIPIHKIVTLNELKKHLFSLPYHPEWIPYKTSYYKEDWGFCLSHNDLLKMMDNEYEVFIDSSLYEGHLTYGEFLLEGELKNEVLISCHICHPSLANDNLSGICLSTILAKYLYSGSPRYSYRFLFIPGTIGAITWLYLNLKSLGKIKNGLVISGVGDSGEISYKRSRRGNAEIDKAVEQVFKDLDKSYKLFDFDPYGYDERQYCSPGFNMPVGRISRTPFGQYPEYHTSADNLEFIGPQYLGEAFLYILNILSVLENNYTYLNLNPKCEPHLGKRGLYDSIGDNEMAMLWVLNMSDGNNDLMDTSKRSGLKFKQIREAASILCSAGLLKETNE